MRPPAVDSTFDVANWFIDVAIENKESIETSKLHVLLYLAQAYYAVLYDGCKLMPSIFVVEEAGPIEPNLQRILESDSQRATYYHPSDNIKPFLQGIWEKFGSHSGLSLVRSVKSHTPYKDAFAIGERTEIPLNAMIAYYSKFLSKQDEGTKKSSEKMRVMRNHTGKTVNVRQWMPKKM